MVRDSGIAESMAELFADAATKFVCAGSQPHQHLQCICGTMQLASGLWLSKTPGSVQRSVMEP